MVKKIGQDETLKLQATCKQCGAILEFYNNEVKTELLISNDEIEGGYDYVQCPVCPNKVEVTTTKP